MSAVLLLRRQFEEVQGRLEAAVEQASVPLALMPDIQVHLLPLLPSLLPSSHLLCLFGHTCQPSLQRVQL